jgi:hypothetical protein
MGRTRKTYFGEAEDGERSGLLSPGSLDTIGPTETLSNPASPKGRYQGLGKTQTPHSLSTPAGLSNAQWIGEEREDDGRQAPEPRNTNNEPTDSVTDDLVVIT